MDHKIQKFCAICECEIHDGLEYCPNCGAKIERIMVKEPMFEDFAKSDYTKTENINRNVSAQKRIDNLAWHHIYCIMSLMSAGPSCTMILSNIMDAISEESIGLLITVLLSGSWTIFVAATSILLLMKKAIGIKCIKINKNKHLNLIF